MVSQNVWSSNSPDLNSVDYKIWGTVQELTGIRDQNQGRPTHELW